MTDRMTPTVPELQCLTELANEYRRQLMALRRNFPSGMPPPPWPSRWQPVLPWQLVRRAN